VVGEEVLAGERVAGVADVGGWSLVDDGAAGSPGPWAEVDDVIGPGDDVEVVFDDDVGAVVDDAVEPCSFRSPGSDGLARFGVRRRLVGQAVKSCTIRASKQASSIRCSRSELPVEAGFLL
jgi:hypothetical protein